jgi:hypothetical protein
MLVEFYIIFKQEIGSTRETSVESYEHHRKSFRDGVTVPFAAVGAGTYRMGKFLT